MATTRMRSWPARAASSWRELERMQAYQVPIVLGGAIAALVGVVAYGLDVVERAALVVPSAREIFLVVFGLLGVIGYRVAHGNARNGVIVAAILMGFPIAFTLMGLGILFGLAAFHRPGVPLLENPVFDNMVLRTYGVMTNDVIIAVPLFIFMGYIVERSGIIDRLFHSLELAMSRVPAALAVATIATCAVFAAATGIVGATVTLMGLLVLPPMLKAGYDVKMSAGAIAAGGCLACDSGTRRCGPRL